MFFEVIKVLFVGMLTRKPWVDFAVMQLETLPKTLHQRASGMTNFSYWDYLLIM